MNDNSLVGIMSIADGCELLQRYQALIKQLLDSGGANTTAKRKALHNAIDASQRYDAELDILLFVTDSALTDIERRISEAGLIKQIHRMIKSLPQGTNLPPVRKDDPRVKRFVESRAQRRALQRD